MMSDSDAARAGAVTSTDLVLEQRGAEDAAAKIRNRGPDEPTLVTYKMQKLADG